MGWLRRGSTIENPAAAVFSTRKQTKRQDCPASWLMLSACSCTASPIIWSTCSACSYPSLGVRRRSKPCARALFFKIGARVRQTARCIRHLATGWPFQNLFRSVVLAANSG
jgi:hypothetical protein